MEASAGMLSRSRRGCVCRIWGRQTWGPELHEDRTEKVMLRAHSPTICPCPASTTSWFTWLFSRCSWECPYPLALLDREGGEPLGPWLSLNWAPAYTSSVP